MICNYTQLDWARKRSVSSIWNQIRIPSNYLGLNFKPRLQKNAPSGSSHSQRQSRRTNSNNSRFWRNRRHPCSHHLKLAHHRCYSPERLQKVKGAVAIPSSRKVQLIKEWPWRRSLIICWIRIRSLKPQSQNHRLPSHPCSCRWQSCNHKSKVRWKKKLFKFLTRAKNLWLNMKTVSFKYDKLRSDFLNWPSSLQPKN